jgi:hypothetical protein
MVGMPAAVEGTPPLPSSWRDLADELTTEQIVALVQILPLFSEPRPAPSCPGEDL